MKRWTYLVSCFLAVSMTLHIMPTGAAASVTDPIFVHAEENAEAVTEPEETEPTEFTEGDFIYDLYDDHADVNKYIGSAQEVVIPDHIKGLPVTGMADGWGNAFYECRGIYSLTIPDTMTDVDFGSSISRCFDMSELLVSDTHPTYASVDGVLFSKDLTTLVRCPCGRSGSYQIPDTVRTIRACAFEECQLLYEITLQEGIEFIGERAFEMCCNVSEFTIPEGVTAIGDSAFRNTPGLVTLRLPSTVTDLGFDPFWDCTGEDRQLENIFVANGNPALSSKDGVLFNADGTELIAYPGGNPRESYSVPEGVTRLHEKSFTENVYLKELCLPASLTDITAIGSGWTEDDNNYYWNLDADIVFAADHPLYTAKDRAIYNKEMTELLYVIGTRDSSTFTVADSVRSIGKSAFKDASDLQEIRLPEGLETIGEDAFAQCDQLISIHIPSTVKEMGDDVFWSCDKLIAVTIPASVETIGSGVFGYCSSLKSITIEGAPGIGSSMLESSPNVKCIQLLSADFTDIESLFRREWYNAEPYNNPTAVIYADPDTETGKAAKLFAEEHSNLTVLPLSAYAARVPGDCNRDGTVTASDAADLLIASAASGAGAQATLTDEQISNADVNGDSDTNAGDAAEILIYAAYIGAGGTLLPMEYFG